MQRPPWWAWPPHKRAAAPDQAESRDHPDMTATTRAMAGATVPPGHPAPADIRDIPAIHG